MPPTSSLLLGGNVWPLSSFGGGGTVPFQVGNQSTLIEKYCKGKGREGKGRERKVK